MRYDPEYNSYKFSNDEIRVIVQSMMCSLANDSILECVDKETIKNLTNNLQSVVCADYCN
jgi:hypothetical protein